MHQETLDLENETVGSLVASDYRKAEVFKRHGIDFCCGGGISVREACEKKGVSLENLERELQHVQQKANATEETDFLNSDARDLIRHILSVHHAYVRESIPVLREFTHKVARVHGGANPEVVEIAEKFAAVADELESHMIKEERILFPYIEQLAEAKGQNVSPDRSPFGTVANPIRMMELEHESAGNVMAEIRRLSNDFTPPEHACTTYRVSYFKLEEFEADLHRHVHLENNILFPQAKALENESAMS